MNKYLRAVVEFPTAMIKIGYLKLVRNNSFRCKPLIFMSLFSELTVDKGARIFIGKNFRQRSQSRIRVRDGAELVIGDDISLNHGCMIVSREKIVIGNGVQFGPNVLLYDHDHDYKASGGISAGKYKSSPIVIGKNVWIGAGSIILRGTSIGDNSIIAAGSVIKGEFSANSTIVQRKRNTIIDN